MKKRTEPTPTETTGKVVYTKEAAKNPKIAVIHIKGSLKQLSDDSLGR